MMVALMMEAARTSETLVNFYQTKRRYNPEDSHLRTHSRENLKPYYMQGDSYTNFSRHDVGNDIRLSSTTAGTVLTLHLLVTQLLHYKAQK
jgi:hypothetical protein